jgi:arylsulfatase A-like enzyme
MSGRPDVLIIVVDQLRRDGLGCYGDPITRTPHLDALAAAGTRFTNCISCHPVCSPWRATLQTGHYAWRHRVQVNNQRIDTSLPSLADAFNQAGYHSAFYGKAHWWDSGKPGFYPKEARLRYQEWWGYNRGHYHWDTPDFDENGTETHAYAGRYEPTVTTDRACAFLDKPADQPRLLCCNYGPPHNASMDAEYADTVNRAVMSRVARERGWPIDDRILDAMASDDPPVVSHFPQHLSGRLLPEAYLGLYRESDFADRPDIPAAERDLVAAMRREYSAMTTSVDDEIGRLLRQVDLDRTLVVVTADHGDHLGSHGRRRGKASHLQAAWRTPLLIAGPGVTAGAVDDRLVSGIDLLPSICGMAGVRPPNGLPGIDLSSGARREQALIGLGNWRALVDETYCYAAAKDDEGWHCRHLINLDDDPWDLDDRQNAEPERAQAMHAAMLTMASAAGDPLLV